MFTAKSMTLVASFTTVGLIAGSGTGAPLLEETFDYATGNLDGASGGSGFQAASNWSVTVPGSATGGAQVEAGSLVFSDYATSGNKLTLSLDTASSFSNLLVERPVGFSATGGDLWMAFLYQRVDTDINGSRTAEARIDGSTPQFGAKPKDSSTQNGTVRYDGSDGTGAGALQEGDVRMIIAKFADLGVDGAVASMWFLDESEYDLIKAGGVTEAELGAAPITDSLAPTDSRTVAAGDTLKLLNSSSQTPFAFSLDELRYGDSLNSVVIPEPGSAAMLALGVAAMASRRRS